MANVIMGALSVCHSEGINGISGEFNFKGYEDAEMRLVKMLNETYPDVVQSYSWLPVVKEING